MRNNFYYFYKFKDFTVAFLINTALTLRPPLSDSAICDLLVSKTSPAANQSS